MKIHFLFLFIVFFWKINGQIITTVAGNGTQGYSGDGGLAISAQFNKSTGLAFDNLGNLYVADNYNNCIRKIDPSGIITTVAGNGISGFSGDGGLATSAQLANPQDVIFDSNNNMYISDGNNNRIRMVNSAGIITTIAGNGMGGYAGDGGQAIDAELNFPAYFAFDAVGNLCFSDYFNAVVRKIDNAGIISTIAGNGSYGFSGDGGPATSAELNTGVIGIAFDGLGNLYIADTHNNRIRMVNTSGIITTVVGTGTAGFSGDGGQATAAEIKIPTGIYCDAAGCLYICDWGNFRVRKVSSLGNITTIIGNGTNGFSGDGSFATNAAIADPIALTLDATGNIFLSDRNNWRIRKITNTINAITPITFSANKISIYPNPTNSIFKITTNTSEKLTLDLYDINGKHLFNKHFVGAADIDVNYLDNGIYTLTVICSSGTINKKLVIAR